MAKCLLCSEYAGPGREDKVANGAGNFLNWKNIARHGNITKKQKKILADAGAAGVAARADGIYNNMTHEQARQAWEQRVRAAAAGSEIFSVEAASSRPGGAVAVSAHTPTPGYRALIATRALLATSNSFRSFDVWRKALVGEETEALESAWHCRRLVMTMAHFDRTVVTHAVLQEGTFFFRLQADGKGRFFYQVEIGTCLWSLPLALRQLHATHGLPSGWLTQLGPRGPWLVDRLIGMQEFPGDMNCDGKASMVEACGSPCSYGPWRGSAPAAASASQGWLPHVGQ
jgi:hypothetical protein